MDNDEMAEFIQNLKVRLTAISGYTQMLERDVNTSSASTEKQRTYVFQLRRVTDDLIRELHRYDNQIRRPRHPKPGTGGNVPPETQGSEGAMLS